MAYNSGGNQSPFVSSVSPTSVTAAGNTTFTIDGALFSPSMTVDVPSGLGSLVSVAVTQPTATTSRAVVVVNVNAPASTATTYQLTLSNGGESGFNSSAEIVLLDFSVNLLLTTDRDFHIAASMGSGAGDGNKVSSLTPAWGGTGTNPRTLTQPTVASQFVYRSSVASVNNQPALEAPTTQNSAKMRDDGVGNSPYLFSPKDTPFTLAAAWKPFAGGSGQRFGARLNYNPPNSASDSYSIYADDDTNLMYLSLNGVQPNYPFGNNDTEGTRYLLIYGGGGSDVTMTEPTTGLNVTITITGTASDLVPGAHNFPLTKNGYFLEFIKLEYVLSATQRANLLSFWQDKYGV